MKKLHILKDIYRHKKIIKYTILQHLISKFEFQDSAIRKLKVLHFFQKINIPKSEHLNFSLRVYFNSETSLETFDTPLANAK